MFDLDADVLERTPGRIVLLTRERPPRDAKVSYEDGRGTLELAGAEPVTVAVHDLPHGVVVVPYDEQPSFVYDVHPEQLAADDAKVERLIRERS
jgi:hypothetical protein